MTCDDAFCVLPQHHDGHHDPSFLDEPSPDLIAALQRLDDERLHRDQRRAGDLTSDLPPLDPTADTKPTLSTQQSLFD